MKNMTSGKPTPLIFNFAVPLLIGNIFQQVYSLVDAIIVGRYLGEEALAGVGSTGNLNIFLISLIMGLCNGAGIIVSQCFGAGEFQKMRKAVTAILWIASVLSVLLAIIGVCFNRLFLQILGVPDNVIEYAVEYLQIIYFFVAGSVAYNGSSAILRSLGNSRTPLYGLIAGSLLNVILDIVFVLHFKMGVSGVAFATVIAQHVSAAVCLTHLIKNRESLGLKGLEKKPDKEMIKLVFRTGVPTAFQNSLISIGGMSVQRLINSFGAAVMAAYTAAGKIDMIAIQVIVSLGTALSVFTGQNIGLHKFDRIKEGLRSTLCMASTAALFIAGVAFIFGENLMMLFLGDDKSTEAISIGAQYLAIMGIAYLICGIMQSYQNVMHGSGDVNICMVAGMTELAGRVFFAHLLTPIMGVTGIWIATPLSWACGCVVPVVRYYTGKWKQKALVDV